MRTRRPVKPKLEVVVASSGKQRNCSRSSIGVLSTVISSLLTLTITIHLDCDLDIYSPATCGHDPNTCKNSMVSWFKSENGNGRMDMTNRSTFPANAVVGDNTHSVVGLRRQLLTAEDCCPCCVHDEPNLAIPPYVFTARCYASAVLAMALCLSVCPPQGEFY